MFFRISPSHSLFLSPRPTQQHIPCSAYFLLLVSSPSFPMYLLHSPLKSQVRGALDLAAYVHPSIQLSFPILFCFAPNILS